MWKIDNLYTTQVVNIMSQDGGGEHITHSRMMGAE